MRAALPVSPARSVSSSQVVQADRLARTVRLRQRRAVCRPPGAVVSAGAGLLPHPWRKVGGRRRVARLIAVCRTVFGALRAGALAAAVAIPRRDAVKAGKCINLERKSVAALDLGRDESCGKHWRQDARLLLHRTHSTERQPER